MRTIDAQSPGAESTGMGWRSQVSRRVSRGPPVVEMAQPVIEAQHDGVSIRIPVRPKGYQQWGTLWLRMPTAQLEEALDQIREQNPKLVEVEEIKPTRWREFLLTSLGAVAVSVFLGWTISVLAF